MALPWEALLHQSSRYLQSSAIRDLLRVTAQPDVISFAGGLPAAELFPVEGMREAFDAVLRTDGAAALQYGPTEGHAPLRAFLCDRLSRWGIRASPEEVLITTGSQQALDLLGKILITSGTPMVVEAPSYVGALQAFSVREPRYIPVAMDAAGLVVDQLRAVLERGERPAMLYTVATFQNPTGVTMSLERREQLLALCAQYELPIVEDNPYGELRYEGQEILPMRGLPGGEETIYLGTFSKIMAPGLRLGWVVAPRPVIAQMTLAKQAADLHTDSLAQRAIQYHFTHADVESHITRLRQVYGERRATMLAGLERSFPEGVRWTRPEGGLFLWVTLPEGMDSKVVLRDALAHNVAFVPGYAFHVDGTGTNTLRLNFSHAKPDRIEEGVRRLAMVLEDHLQSEINRR